MFWHSLEHSQPIAHFAFSPEHHEETVIWAVLGRMERAKMETKLLSVRADAKTRDRITPTTEVRTKKRLLSCTCSGGSDLRFTCRLLDGWRLLSQEAVLDVSLASLNPRSGNRAGRLAQRFFMRFTCPILGIHQLGGFSYWSKTRIQFEPASSTAPRCRIHASSSG